MFCKKRQPSFVVFAFPVFSLSLVSSGFADQVTPQSEKALSKGLEAARQKLEEDANRGKRFVERFVSKAEEATRLFDELGKKAEEWNTKTHSLLKSDDGKRLAGSASLEGVVELYQSPPIDSEELSIRRRAANAILDEIRGGMGLPDVGFFPSERLQEELDDHYYWAKSKLLLLSDRDSKLGLLLSKAPPLADGSQTRTLEEAMRDRKAAYLAFVIDSITKGRASAKDESEKILIEKGHLAEIEQARTEAERLYEDQKKKNETLTIEHQLQMQELRKQEQKRLTEKTIEYEDAMAENARLRKMADAKRHAADTDVELARNEIVSAAEEKRLIAKCRDPEVRRILAPFLDTGYFRPSSNMHPSNKYNVAQAVPISWGDIESLGCLLNTGDALNMLHKIASTPNDKMRTRWPGQKNRWQNDPGLAKLVPEAQKLLIELGPTLKNEGLLQK